MDPQVVFLQPKGVEAEGFAVDTIGPDTHRKLGNHVIGMEDIGLGRAGHQAQRADPGGQKMFRCKIHVTLPLILIFFPLISSGMVMPPPHEALNLARSKPRAKF